MRGFWYMVEAILASIIILTFLFAITSKYLVLPQDADLTVKGYEILKGLDDQDVLRSYVVLEDSTGLNSQIQLFSNNHTIQICRSGGECIGNKPNATNRYIATYIVAGNITFAPYEVRLYIY